MIKIHFISLILVRLTIIVIAGYLVGWKDQMWKNSAFYSAIIGFQNSHCLIKWSKNKINFWVLIFHFLRSELQKIFDEDFFEFMPEFGVCLFQHCLLRFQLIQIFFFCNQFFKYFIETPSLFEIFSRILHVTQKKLSSLI